MPELPEVETIVRWIRPHVEGRKITDLRSDTPRIFRDCRSVAAVTTAVRGKRILSADRAGKNIIFRLEGAHDLWLHLMMSGSLFVSCGESTDPYVRAVFVLDNGTMLLFRDIRKFGRIRLVKKEEQVHGLGPDALAISFSDFLRRFHKAKAIKPLLLEQNSISGIGNIYADEILWHAGIHPERSAASLSRREIHAIYRAMKKVLTEAIRSQGTSFRDYRKPDGERGGYFENRKVYQRAGEPCSRDHTIIKRITLAQRGTHFCPKHQR